MCFENKPIIVATFTGINPDRPREVECELCKLFSGTTWKAESPASMLPHFTWHHGVSPDYLKINNGGIILNGG